MRRLSKPIRLYVVTIFVVLAYGILPFFSVMPFGREVLLFGLWNLPLNGSIYLMYGPDGVPSFTLVLVSLFLCVFSAASAVGAFYGWTIARIATPLLVTLNVLWWTLLVIMIIANSDVPTPDLVRLAIEPVPPLFWLGFIWWNYTRTDVIEYCRQESAV